MSLTRAINGAAIRNRVRSFSCDRPRINESKMGCGDSAEIADLLTISPGEEIRFSSDMPNARIPLTLNNITSASVAFKVKTTSPEKFRVKPSTGVVTPGSHVTIELALCEGFSVQQIVSDKFLLLATPVGSENFCPRDLCKLWKNLPADQRFEHKLRCVVETARRDGMSVMIGMQMRDLNEKMDCLQERLEMRQRCAERQMRLQSRTIKFTMTLSVLVLVVLGVDVFMTLNGSRGGSAGYALYMVRKSAIQPWPPWFS